MNEFLLDIHYFIFKQYILSQFPQGSYLENADQCDYIKNDELECQVNLWNNQIIEFQKFNHQEIEYYLHFQFMDLYKAKQLLQDYLSYFKKSDVIPLQLLITCTGGFTSNFFADGLKNYIQNHHLNACVDACSYTHIPEIVDQYDWILLAPQLSYLKSQYSQYHHVVIIPTNIYATYNYSEAIEFILSRK